MSALAEFDISSIAPPILIVGMTMLLAHFFNDADRHRSFCEKLRAKYILMGKGPLDYLADNLTTGEKLQVEIFEDFLTFRLIKIHFGIISSIITLGLSLLILIIGNAAFSCCLGSKYFFALSFIAITFFVLLVQFAYIEQQGGTARRLDEIQKIDLGEKGCFEQQCMDLLNGKVKPIKNWEWGFSRFCIFAFRYPKLIFFLTLIPLTARIIYILLTNSADCTNVSQGN